jgi:hypothetical protein
MRLPHLWRELHELTVTDERRGRGGDVATLPNSIPAEWSILLTFEDLHATRGLRTRATIRHFTVRKRAALNRTQNLEMARSK